MTFLTVSSLIYLAYLSIGIAFCYLVVKKPENFLFLVTTSIITASGAEIMGYPIVDELLVSMLFLGIIIRFYQKRTLDYLIVQNSSLLSLHAIFFSILIIYLIFQSLRGMFILSDLKMIRWLVFFITLGVLSIIFAKSKTILNRNLVIKVLLITSTAYFFLYLSLGILFEYFFNIDWHFLQGKLWTGTAAMTVPLIIYLTSAISFLSEKKSKWIFLINLIVFTIIVSTSLYYNSRGSQLIIIGTLLCNLVINLIRFNIKSIMLSLLTIGIFVMIFNFWKVELKIESSLQDYIPYNLDQGKISMPKIIKLSPEVFGFESATINNKNNNTDNSISNSDEVFGFESATINNKNNNTDNSISNSEVCGNWSSCEEKRIYEANSDKDRIYHHIAAFQTIKKSNLVHQLFGYGWYIGGKYEMIDEVLIIRKENGLSTDILSDKKTLQPTAAAAIFVDTGLIGTFLILVNIFLSFTTIIRSKDANKYLISLVYLNLIFIFFLGNVTPMLLTWLMMMPNSPFLLILKRN